MQTRRKKENKDTRLRWRIVAEMQLTNTPFAFHPVQGRC